MTLAPPLEMVHGDRPARNVRPANVQADFTRAPFLIAWEVTRACALKCLHCRADAIPHRDPFGVDGRGLQVHRGGEDVR